MYTKKGFHLALYVNFVIIYNVFINTDTFIFILLTKLYHSKLSNVVFGCYIAGFVQASAQQANRRIQY